MKRIYRELLDRLLKREEKEIRLKISENVKQNINKYKECLTIVGNEVVSLDSSIEIREANDFIVRFEKTITHSLVQGIYEVEIALGDGI